MLTVTVALLAFTAALAAATWGFAVLYFSAVPGLSGRQQEPGSQHMAETTGARGHQPDETTVYDTGGLPGKVRRADDYPLDAMCKGCGKPIRCQEYGGTWTLKYQ